MQDTKIVKLGIQNWRVHEAYPPTDIIWSEIDQIANDTCVWKQLLITTFTMLLSLALFAVIGYADLNAFVTDQSLKLIMRYFCPLLWAFYSLYLNPWLVFKLIKWENTPLKSIKEQSFLSKFNFNLIFNLVVAPWLTTYLLTFIEFSFKVHDFSFESDDGEYKQFDHFEAVLLALQTISAFYFRLFC